MDVCLVLELLEHVTAWEACLAEFDRVLRPGGVLVLTTTNKLCPRQQEFRLPLYSWYPARLKRRFERMASTTHPHLANFATYPAVNWFSFSSLAAALPPAAYDCLDRFDVMDPSRLRPALRGVLTLVRGVPPIRWLAHVATPGTLLFAVKRT